jgi:hypothetical protein
VLILERQVDNQLESLSIKLPIGQSSFDELLRTADVNVSQQDSTYYRLVFFHCQNRRCVLRNQNDTLSVVINNAFLSISEQMVLEEDAQIQIGLLTMRVGYDEPKIHGVQPIVKSEFRSENKSNSDASPSVASTKAELDDFSWDDLLKLNDQSSLPPINPHKLEEAVLLNGEVPTSTSVEKAQVNPFGNQPIDELGQLFQEYWVIKRNRSLLSEKEATRLSMGTLRKSGKVDELAVLLDKGAHHQSIFDILNDSESKESAGLLDVNTNTGLESFELFREEQSYDVLDLLDHQIQEKNKGLYKPVPTITQREHHILSLDSALSLAKNN